MATRREKITKALVDGLRPLPGEELFIIDTDLDGFGYRLKPSGSGYYFVKYFLFDGPRRRDARTKIAGGNAAPDQARKIAKTKLAEIALGRDPSAEKKAEREAVTVEQLCAEYLEAARAGRVMTRFGKPKRASTVAIDEGRVARHIVPLLGEEAATKLTRADVQRMSDAIAAGRTAGEHKTKARGVAKVTGGAGTAARVVELLGGIWTWAERRGLVSGANPARGVEKHKGDAKDRVLTSEELARLGAVLQAQEAARPMSVAALRLIALTGLRREEACGLRWSEVDTGASCLRLQATKTGRNMRPIGKPAAAHLAALPRLGDYVFPNRAGTGPADLKKSLADLFDAAGLHDARSHDLRRTFASVADELGYGDATIGELLGHAKKGVTQKHYVRRPDSALVAAADRVAARIAAALEGREAEIVPINPSRAHGD
jgi:integrase